MSSRTTRRCGCRVRGQAFDEDVFDPDEGFTGLEDTAVRSAWAHGRGGGLVPFPV